MDALVLDAHAPAAPQEVAAVAPVAPQPIKGKRVYRPGYMTDWWLIGKDGQRTEGPNKACFGGARWSEGAQGFEYLCYVSPTLREEHVRFWLRFLGHLFEMESPKSLKWSAELILNSDEVQDRPINVRYRIEGPLSSHAPKNLLYATAFRYIDEIPLVVLPLYERRAEAEDPNAMFLLFQQVHQKAAPGGGHSMYCTSSYYGDSSKTAIPLARFHERLRKESARSVFAHFS